jgi:hypothetical protein
MMKLVLGAAAALALALATPASACPDCKSCPHGKKDTVAQAEKKDDSCHCVAKAGECKCGDKCACANCPVHGKKGEKKEEKKS